jgi:transcriptional regulator with XRE-family HTH domain
MTLTVEPKFAPSRLREARKRKGLSQRALARALGISESRLCNWESGYAQPSAEHLYVLCKVLGCGFEELFEQKIFFKEPPIGN